MNVGIYIGNLLVLNKKFILLFSELCDYQWIKLWKPRKSESGNLSQYVINSHGHKTNK